MSQTLYRVHITFSVIGSIATPFSEGWTAALLSDNTVVLYSKEKKRLVLKRYNVIDQRELETVPLEDEPERITELVQNGVCVLALSYG